MEAIIYNPYRTVGLLVGASAREQDRQIRRLKQFIEAEQEPKDDFSFPALGNIKRTIESINEAASKLNLDNDKMHAALFWFYKGNMITDEPAFDALKEGDIKSAISIWAKLTNDKEVDPRNLSAFANLSNLLLSASINNGNIKEDLLEKGIRLKLKFLESDFIEDFKDLATDETYKTSKKDVQLMFLNQVQSELGKNGGFTSAKFLEILNKNEFSAKSDFLKTFAQQPIALIEKQIEIAKAKRKAKKEDVIVAGTDLFNGSKANLDLLKSILGTSDLKYISISDKVSDEVLQCGIQLFNDFKDHDTYDPGPPAMDLFRKAKTLAIGSIAKQRCQENTDGLQEWIDDGPERVKNKLVKAEIEFITSKLERFQSLSDTINNAKDLIDSCKPKVVKIRSVLGAYDELYLAISSTVVQNAQNMLVAAVNEVLNHPSIGAYARLGMNHPTLQNTIESALDITFKLGSFDMHPSLRSHYNKNLEGIKSIASQLSISTLSPREKVQQELNQAERKLKEIQNQVFFKSEINLAHAEMNRIQQWQFLRSEADRQSQIANQQNKIKQLMSKSENEKATQIRNQQNTINALKTKLQQIDY